MISDSHTSFIPLAAPDDLLAQEAAAFRASQRFPQVVRAYTEGLARFREAPWIVNKLAAYDLRMRVVAFLLYLDADSQAPPGQESGATYGRLLELCMRRNEVSPRVLKTTLTLLKLAGLVQVKNDPDDRRRKFYHPTERLADFIGLWLGYAIGALEVLEPDNPRAQWYREDPDFVSRFFLAAGHDYMSDMPLTDRLPDFVSFFGGREGASAVIVSVMLAHFDGTEIPSRAKIGRRFGISKTQIGKVIREGEERGYWTLDATTAPVATSHLHAQYGHWISLELAFYARHMRP
ncbi:DNA-binding MarR family transcriptional regulator [Pararhizobium capsulatum DSM 1112]|uniref:DNA-binding MarR family transcriptional regulator n=1 Tax=Pararhizobium capsulatum DSM 1112 TaxID=1121113 RepID=A0ABU0C0T5_9HYPH|nr:hypothetical protein [Pararhizobium capsulatum]MDQ0323511.1 DNA-binding MarR family transcriptional regulator [Pararhizobium capsulatum DSM 1112]